MSGHTPGPWKAEGEMVSAHHVAGDPRLEYWICEEVNGDSRAGATCGRPSDNARLIAAAPELLEALINCAAEVRRDAEHIAYAAKGFGDDDGIPPIESTRLSAIADMADAAIARATGEQP